MAASIRMATVEDGNAVAEIYGPFCDSTVVSFEFGAPPAEEMAARIGRTVAQLPWLVLDDGGVAGYAYASRHRDRSAYGWSVDTAVYVSPGYHRCGIGRALYTALFRLLRRQGYFKAYAGVTIPNSASTGLHESLGFGLVGVYKGVGYKHGAWRDVAWYQRALQPERIDPEPPLPIGELVESEDWVEAVAQALAHYRRPVT
jgi:L-amino acid N-acyltransferase YncA